MARRMFGHGELHLVVLTLLQHQPMHGYQLLAELTRLFAPDYKPSPGSIYPAIQALHDAGLVTDVEEAGRRVYHLSDSGAEAVHTRRGELAVLEARTGVRISSAKDLDAALDAFSANVRNLAHAVEPDEIRAVLEHALHRIRGLSQAPTKHTTTPKPRRSTT